LKTKRRARRRIDVLLRKRCRTCGLVLSPLAPLRLRIVTAFGRDIAVAREHADCEMTLEATINLGGLPPDRFAKQSFPSKNGSTPVVSEWLTGRRR